MQYLLTEEELQKLHKNASVCFECLHEVVKAFLDGDLTRESLENILLPRGFSLPEKKD